MKKHLWFFISLAPKSADIPKKNTVSDGFSQMHFPKRAFSQWEKLIFCETKTKKSHCQFYIIKWQCSLSNSFAYFKDIISIFEMDLVLGFLVSLLLQHCDFWNWTDACPSRLTVSSVACSQLTDWAANLNDEANNLIGLNVTDKSSHVELETKQIDTSQQITYFEISMTNTASNIAAHQFELCLP
jgi:hypothetical protein